MPAPWLARAALIIGVAVCNVTAQAVDATSLAIENTDDAVALLQGVVSVQGLKSGLSDKALEAQGEERTTRVTHPATSWPPASQLAAGVGALGMLCIFLLLLQFLGDHDEAASVTPLQNQAPTAWALEPLSAAAAACAMALDGIVATLVLSLLPELCGGGGAPILLFLRPVVAVVTAVVLLPACIRTGAAWGHFVTSVGLLLLAVSCLFFAAATTVSIALMGQVAHAVASAIIFVTVMHSRMQEGTSGIGSRLAPVLAGLAVGHGCAPWIGAMLHESCGIQDMFLVFAWVAACACGLHFGIFSHAVTSKPGDALVNADVERQDNTISILEAMGLTSLSWKRVVLLWGIASCAASLAAHNIAVPLYLQSLDRFDESSSASFQGQASTVFVLAIVAASTAFDRLDTFCVAQGMVVALVLSILGLRTLVMVQAGQAFIAIGLAASLGGVGLYLGLAVPLFAFLASSANGSTTTGRAQFHYPVDPSTSGALCAFWFCGDAVGTGAQLVLCPFIGTKFTLLAFACGLGLHAAAVLGCGWPLTKR